MIWIVVFSVVGLLLVLFAIYAIKVLVPPPRVHRRVVDEYSDPGRGDCRVMGPHWLRKHSSGLWEMYLCGEAFERGYVNGKLAADLLLKQEKYFIEALYEKVPGRVYISFLRYIVAWLNRNLHKNVGEELNREIYGISRSAPPEYNFVGPPYIRYLNYHAAHDIGHTLQYLNFVACSAFAVWGSRSSNGRLIHARNFDFYMGDDFCREKIVTFVRPEHGHPFMAITWGGMAGTVSGMNACGLAISVNAARSGIPLRTAMPISVLIREMLQYAATPDQAYEIASRRNIFVSEIIMVTHGKSQTAMLIEKTPFTTVRYRGTDGQLLCTNHFQSPELLNDPMNVAQMAENASSLRFSRLEELLGADRSLDVAGAAAVLRNRMGPGGEDAGMGNESALNQMVAHHSVIFEPETLKAWVSAGPYCLGRYICYDLNLAFGKGTHPHPQNTPLTCDSDEIPPSPDLDAGLYERMLEWRKLQKSLLKLNGRQAKDAGADVDAFIRMNPVYFESWTTAGDVLARAGDYPGALNMYHRASELLIPDARQRRKLAKSTDKAVRKAGGN